MAMPNATETEHLQCYMINAVASMAQPNLNSETKQGHLDRRPQRKPRVPIHKTGNGKPSLFISPIASPMGSL